MLRHDQNAWHFSDDILNSDFFQRKPQISGWSTRGMIKMVDIFQMTFWIVISWKETFYILIPLSLKFFLRCPIENMSTLVQEMAWYLQAQTITWSNVHPHIHGHNELEPFLSQLGYKIWAVWNYCFLYTDCPMLASHVVNYSMRPTSR